MSEVTPSGHVSTCRIGRHFYSPRVNLRFHGGDGWLCSRIGFRRSGFQKLRDLARTHSYVLVLARMVIGFIRRWRQIPARRTRQLDPLLISGNRLARFLIVLSSLAVNKGQESPLLSTSRRCKKWPPGASSQPIKWTNEFATRLCADV